MTRRSYVFIGLLLLALAVMLYLIALAVFPVNLHRQFTVYDGSPASQLLTTLSVDRFAVEWQTSGRVSVLVKDAKLMSVGYTPASLDTTARIAQRLALPPVAAWVVSAAPYVVPSLVNKLRLTAFMIYILPIEVRVDLVAEGTR